MTVLGAQRGSTYLAIGAGYGAAWISGEIPVAFMAVATLAAVLSWFLGEQTTGKYATPWTVGIVGAFGALAFFWLTGRLDIVIAATMFALLITVYLLFNRGDTKGNRRLQLASLLLVLGGAALSADLVFGLFFAIYGIASTWSLTLNQLRVEIEEEAKANAVADGGRSMLLSSRLVTPGMLAGWGGLAMGALVLAAAVFVLFPRVSFNLWQRRGNLGAPRTGFSDSVQLGSVGLIKTDARIAFRFTPPEGTKQRETLDLHWRGATFDTWDGRGWSDSRGRLRPVRQEGDLWYRVAGKRGERTPDGNEWKVETAPDVEATTVFSLPGTRRVRLPPKVVALRTVPGPTLLIDGSSDLAFAPASPVEVTYLLEVGPEPAVSADVPPDAPELPDDGERWLQLPEGMDARYAALARTLTASKGRISAVNSVLSQFAGYRYSLANEPQGPDPLASFTFDVKAGHCEYFASSMTVLLRSAGIPARVVTGFYGGRWVENGGYYVIRQGDAHAWVEVWFPEAGWLTFDPTPVDSRPAALETTWGRLQLWLDGLREQWRRSVVDYDILAQVQGLKGLVDLAKEASQRLGESSGTRPGLVSAGRVVLMVALLVVLLVGLAWGIQRLRAGAGARQRTESQKRARALLLEVQSLLEKRGVPRLPTQTPLEQLAVARLQQVPGVETLVPVVTRGLEARYGRRALAQAEFEALRGQVRAA